MVKTLMFSEHFSGTICQRFHQGGDNLSFFLKVPEELFIFKSTLKGSSINFTHQSLLTAVGGYYCICGKKSYKALCDSIGRCVKSDKLPQVISLESVSVGLKAYKLEKKKNGFMELERSYQSSVAGSSSLLPTSDSRLN